MHGKALLASRYSEPSELEGLKCLLGFMLEHDDSKLHSAEQLLTHH